MTSPLSPEAVAHMVADREAGTPGPWAYRPDPYDDWGVVKAGPCVLCQVRDPEAIDEAVLSSHRRNGTDPWEANASRIARLPDLEAAYLTLAAENATLRAEIDIWTAEIVSWKMVVEAVERDVDREYKRAETAETELATLRASEAAALERAEKAEKRIAFLEAPIRQAFTIKSECDACGRQSIDLLPGCACPKWNCGGSMVAKIGGI